MADRKTCTVSPEVFFNAVIQLIAAMLPHADYDTLSSALGDVDSIAAEHIVGTAVALAAQALVEVDAAFDPDELGETLDGLVTQGAPRG